MARVTNVGASDGIRTRDGRNHNPGLYQLSYARHRGPRKLYRNANAGAPDGAPGGTRTPDRRIRNPLLYPAELRAHGENRAAPECITGPFPLLATQIRECWVSSRDRRVRGPGGVSTGFSEISRSALPEAFSCAARLRSPRETTPTRRLSRSTTGSRRTWFSPMFLRTAATLSDS